MIHHIATAKLGLGFIITGIVLGVSSFAGHVDAFITAIPSTISVIVGIILIIRGQNKLHVAVNSRLSDLLALTSKSSKAEGKEEERQDEVERNKYKK